MAEVLYDDDDDEELWIEDPYDEADDLAEHTMHSPILINYDPSFEIDDDWNDWEYYSDDFYDSDGSKVKRRKVDKAANGQEGPSTKLKRRKSESIGKLPELSLGEPLCSDEEDGFRAQPTVVWKSREDPPQLPVLIDGQQEKVSILKDWKGRFKPPPPSNGIKPRSINGCQQVLAVVIEQKSNSNDPESEGDATPSAIDIPRKRRRSMLGPDGTASPNADSEGPDSTTDLPSKRKKRGRPRLSAPAPEPVLANGSFSSKRKRYPKDADEASPQRKIRTRGGSDKPPEANGLDVHQAIDDGDAEESTEETDRLKAEVHRSVDQRKMTNLPTRKRKTPSTQEDAVSKPALKQAKSKPSETESTKENSRPKAKAVGRRSTRRK
ncbi:MAG: hypothetical protein Q9170_006598 [Blastenia crenularia]